MRALWRKRTSGTTGQVDRMEVERRRCCCSFHLFPSAPADDAKSDDGPEGRLNGDRETLDEMDESRREDKNGFKAKFMFNIADGGFTGKN